MLSVRLQKPVTVGYVFSSLGLFGFMALLCVADANSLQLQFPMVLEFQNDARRRGYWTLLLDGGENI
jgi:hypothetical protein